MSYVNQKYTFLTKIIHQSSWRKWHPGDVHASVFLGRRIIPNVISHGCLPDDIVLLEKKTSFTCGEMWNFALPSQLAFKIIFSYCFLLFIFLHFCRKIRNKIKNWITQLFAKIDYKAPLFVTSSGHIRPRPNVYLLF